MSKQNNKLQKVVVNPSDADYVGALLKRRLGVLYDSIPPYAIKERQGKGGRYRYVPHGYVKHTLNMAFGLDWDFRLLPVFNGNIYVINITSKMVYEKGKWVEKPNRNITVYGELVVRVRDENGSVLTTFVRSGGGSQDWNESMEFGDAFKGASSDALKVCASSIGKAFGLQLYWDDDMERSDAAPSVPPTPKSLGELFTSVFALGQNMDDVLAETGKPADYAIKADDISSIWETAKRMAAEETSERFVPNEE